MRFWASWWTGNYAAEGCTKPPFQVWCTGHRDRARDGQDEQSLCAVIDVESELDAYNLISRHYPDAQFRFVDEKPDDWMPNEERFPR